MAGGLLSPLSGDWDPTSAVAYGTTVSFQKELISGEKAAGWSQPKSDEQIPGKGKEEGQLRDLLVLVTQISLYSGLQSLCLRRQQKSLFLGKPKEPVATQCWSTMQSGQRQDICPQGHLL